MKDAEKKVALLAVTNEILDGKFVLFTGVKKFQEKVGVWLSKIKNIPAPGEYIEYGDYPFSRKIFWPLDVHLINNIDLTSGCSFQIYKLYFWNNEYFSDKLDYYVDVIKQELVGAIVNRVILPTKEDIYGFIMLMFMGNRSVRGGTRKKLINFDTPCSHFFHADVDGISLGIGSPIEKRFGLETFGFKWGLPSHSFSLPEDVSLTFYGKYPLEEISTHEFTLSRFCDMVYDLVRIKHGLFILN